MVVTDPIADLLTRIRNASSSKHETVDVPASNMKKAIVEILNADILLNEGFIKNAEVVEENGHSNIVITLKYGAHGEKVISNLKRVSKPGLRVYCGCEDLPSVLNGLGIAIISTSKGVMTDKEARKNKIGGEVLAYIW